jgi:hypothetical protein
MNKTEIFEKRMKQINKIPLWVKQQRKINTLENELDVANDKIKNLENIIKSDLYKDFTDKLESPHKIEELKETLKIRTQQRNAVRDEFVNVREENRKLEESAKDYDLVIKQRDRYKKQVKSLKEIIKEGRY